MCPSSSSRKKRKDTHAVEASPLSSFAQNPSLFPLRNLVISEINSSIKESETYISEVAVIMGEEHSTVSSITSSSCHIFLNIILSILSFIVKPSFSPRLKFEIITYFQGSIIDPRRRKERKNKPINCEPSAAGRSRKGGARECRRKNRAAHFELRDFERSRLCSDTVVPVAGLEPARLSALDFESSTSTNSITPANAVV